MKKLKIQIVILLFLYHPLFAQMISNVEAIESGGALTQYNMIGKERPAPEVKGEYYLFKDWVVADLGLDIDKTITDQKLNLNLQDGDIEIPYGENVRILDKSKIRSFTVDNRKFINSKYVEGSAMTDSFFEVLDEGTIRVYCQYYSDVRPPTYVPGLAVGDRNYKVLIKKRYFIGYESTLEAFGNDKKRNTEYFKKNELAIDYVRQEKLKLNRIDDFIITVKFYNNND
ncbi:MAG: hypothetical protein WAU36_15305 [Cyclobacteriaceae bacterium]